MAASRFSFGFTFVILVASWLVSGSGNTSTMAQEWVYIASRPQEKIYRCTLQPNGELTEMEVAVAEVRPQFFALHPDNDILYVGTDEGDRQAGVRAYQFDRATGELTFLSKALTNDNGSTHIAISNDGRTLLSCAYGGSGTSSLSVDKDGNLIEGATRIDHDGKSVNEQRQERHHPHGIAIHRDGKFACVADLGNDHIEIYAITDGKIAKHGRWKTEEGSGPRHVAFHENGRWLYSINELSNNIDVLNFDSESGTLSLVQRIDTLPADFNEQNTTAEILIHPNGKFLYGSNRGHDSTAVYSIDQADGTLTMVQLESTGGDHPRHVSLNSDASLYVAANMHSDDLTSFQVDQATGQLKPTGHQIKVDEPRCVIFVGKK